MKNGRAKKKYIFKMINQIYQKLHQILIDETF